MQLQIILISGKTNVEPLKLFSVLTGVNNYLYILSLHILHWMIYTLCTPLMYTCGLIFMEALPDFIISPVSLRSSFLFVNISINFSNGFVAYNYTKVSQKVKQIIL